MSLIKEIKEQLKAKATGVNLSNKTQDEIAAFIDADISTVEEIDAALNTYAKYRPFADIAKEDDRKRLAETKAAADKEAARLKAIAEGKPAPVEVDPNESATDKMLRLLLERQEKQDATIASMLGEKVTNTLVGSAEARLKTKYADYPELIADVLTDVKERGFKDEDSLNTFLDRKEASLGAFIQASSNNGLGGDRPAGGSGGNTKQEKVSPAVAAFIAKSAEERKVTV